MVLWIDEKRRAADTEKGISMAKHLLVEELASLEHQAGPWKLHELEAYVGMHNRGCVWDKVATAWAGDEEWIFQRKNQGDKDKRDFVTFALSHVKQSAIHRQKMEE